MKFPFPVAKAMDQSDYNSDGVPLVESCVKFDWATSELSYEMSSAFGLLYRKYKSEFADVWRYIADGLKDLDNVVGYELLNEPFPGSIWSNPSLLVPSMNENTILEF